MNGLNPRQQEFIRSVKFKRKPASEAYADAYGGNKADKSTQVKASQLLRNPKIQMTLEELERTMHTRAVQAVIRNEQLALDPKTSAQTKNDINKWLSGLGGVTPVQRIETKNEMVLKGINDEQSKIDLAKLFYKKHVTDKQDS